jgi:uncharacterized membrane protein (DUF373 family)
MKGQPGERVAPSEGAAPTEGDGLPPHGETPVPFTQVHGLLRRSLEHAQDVIVVGLAAVLFMVMTRNLLTLGRYVLGPEISVRDILGQALFMMMLIELLRLLVLYLRDHHVAVDVMVETSIVATLREVILRDVVELPPLTIGAIALFVLTLGLLLRYGDLRGRACGGRDGALYGDRPSHRRRVPRGTAPAG